MSADELPLFSRSAIGGKKSSDVKARVSDETKFALQRKCAELGMTESEFIDRLLCVALFGVEEVINAEQKKTMSVAGLWPNIGPRKTDS